MATYSDFVRDGYQRPIPGATAKLFTADGTTQVAMATTGADGQFTLDAPDGKYLLEVSFGGVSDRSSVLVGKPPEFVGPTGPANSTYPDLTALKDADPANLSFILTTPTGPITYAYVAGNFTGKADNLNVVTLNGTPSATGALVRQSVDSVAYRAPAAAAQTQSQGEKNQQTVDFYDALTPAMRASVNSGNLAVDCSAALNAITTFSYGGESIGDATGGTTLYIKGGRYRLNSGIKNTYRRDNQIVDDGDLRRLNIQGDGSNNTSLFYFGDTATPAIETAGYRGTTNNDGVAMRQKISGVRLRRWPIASKTGIGMRISHAEGMHLEDVIVDGFEVNLFATDVLEFFADKFFMKDCSIGARFQLSDFTNPNIVRFDGGGVSGASTLGLHFVRPANVTVGGGFRAEGNGFDSAFRLILAELGTPEGGFSLGVYDSYFENNMGQATLSLAHSYASDAMVEFARNTVHNDSSTRFMQHHVDYARVGAAASANSNCVIAHGPQRYRNIGSYVSDPSRSAVRLQTLGGVLVEHAGNRYPTDNERPETNGFPTVGLTYTIMMVSVFVDGTYTQDFNINPNLLKVERPAGEPVGVFRVFYRTAPRAPGSVVATCSLASGNGSATVYDRTSTYVQVNTYDPSGAPADRAFTLNVQGAFA